MNTMLLLLLLPQGNTVLLFQSFELFFVQYLFSITTTSIYRVDTVAQTQSLPVWSNRVVGIDRGVFLLLGLLLSMIRRYLYDGFDRKLYQASFVFVFTPAR